MSATRVDAVIHFAAYAYVGESVTDPAQVLPQQRRQHARPCSTRMLAARRRDVVFSQHLRDLRRAASRCRSPRTTRRTPDQPLRRDQARRRADAGRLRRRVRPAATRRCATSTPPGADPTARIGEDHDPETHLIPLAIEAALGKRPHVESSAPTTRRRTAPAIRDYIHVDDLAEAHLRALEKLRDGAAALRLNLGTGRGQSVRASSPPSSRSRASRSARGRSDGAPATRRRWSRTRARQAPCWAGNRATRSSTPSSSTRSAGARTASVRDADLGAALAPAA